MITNNVSTLKINKLTQAQYDRELAAGNIKEDEIYLTPSEVSAVDDMLNNLSMYDDNKFLQIQYREDSGDVSLAPSDILGNKFTLDKTTGSQFSGLDLTSIGEMWFNMRVCKTLDDIASLDFEIINVCTYGAQGDGTTDDSGAIQSALDACHDAGGGTVYFPVGTYLLNSCVYYDSNMTLLFEKGAVLKRGSASLRYLLANDISNTVTEYNGTHDVRIIGATFDGNSAFSITSSNDNKCTLLNTGHAKNITVENCTFKNGNVWHYYEVAASENVKIINCIFDGSNYGGTTQQQEGYSELLQFDNDCVTGSTASYGATKNGTSGDLTPCKNVHVTGCKFIGNGHNTAIGNHNPQRHEHTYIRISDCYFTGGCSAIRGYISFDESSKKIDIYNNTFDDRAVSLYCTTDTLSTIHDNRIDADVAFTLYGGVTVYGNLINGIIDAAGEDDAIETISFETFAKIKTAGSENGYATLQSADIKKYRRRIMGEIKFTAVTTNSGNCVLPMEVNAGYRPKVTAGITAEQKQIVGTGYISATNGNTRIAFSSSLSNKDISVRFDYAI